MMKSPYLAPASFLALGLVFVGIFISDGLKNVQRADRVVSVRGFSERVVPADRVVWPIHFSLTAGDLTSLQRELDVRRQSIREFLLSAGFDSSEVSSPVPQITDREAIGYAEPYRGPRYSAMATVLLRSGKVALVQKTQARSGELVAKGIALNVENWEMRTQFLFTKLDSIKPAMIREATRNARSAAQQFAEDSESKVGRIMKATQGLFTIEDDNPASPELKRVRVVTVVDYELKD
jgi:hypothetical protein